ncbi:MAG: hypothetical protein V5B34_03030 [Accumulibacter sp.]|jgi:hypothetical protein
MNGKAELIEVDLRGDGKKLILDLAGLWVSDETTQADLRNRRKKSIRFRRDVFSELIGELSYHCNRCRNAYQLERLDTLIDHLESVVAGRSHGSVRPRG